MTITGSTIEDPSGNGLDITGPASPILLDDYFSYCTTCGNSSSTGSSVDFLSPPGSWRDTSGDLLTPSLAGLQSSGFHLDAVEVSPGVLSTVTAWAACGLPYFVAGDVTVSSSGGLTVLPGVTILMDGGLTVQGDLELAGQPGALINLTSWASLTGNAKPGDWPGITYAPAATGEIDFASIDYAGKTGSALDLRTSNPINITDSTIDHSAGDDVAVTAGIPELQADTFGTVTTGSLAVDDTRASGPSIVAWPDTWNVSNPSTTVAGSVQTEPFYTAQSAVASTTSASVAVGGQFGDPPSFGVNVEGQGYVSVHRLSGDPTHTGQTGAFFDVDSWRLSTFKQAVVEDCDATSGEELLYLAGSGWEPVSNSASTSGCLKATITPTSRPSLATLLKSRVFFNASLLTTTVALVPSPASPTYGHDLRLKTWVNAGSQRATGSVDFFQGANQIGSSLVQNGVAQLTVPHLAVGAYSFSAKFVPASGSAFSTSSSSVATVTVQKATLSVRVAVTVPYTVKADVSDLPPTSSDLVYAGFIGGDSPKSSLSGHLSCSTKATANSPSADTRFSTVSVCQPGTTRCFTRPALLLLFPSTRHSATSVAVLRERQVPFLFRNP